MNWKVILVMISSILCSYGCSNPDFKKLEHNQKQESGLDNWGRGATPWMSDRDEKQHEQARRSKQMENSFKNRNRREG